MRRFIFLRKGKVGEVFKQVVLAAVADRKLEKRFGRRILMGEIYLN